MNSKNRRWNDFKNKTYTSNDNLNKTKEFLMTNCQQFVLNKFACYHQKNKSMLPHQYMQMLQKLCELSIQNDLPQLQAMLFLKVQV